MCFASWHNFTEEFTATFCPENEATTALMWLESDWYCQGKQNVETYIDEFKDLIDLSGYTDSIAMVLKFHRGLNPTTQDRIAESGMDRPSDTDFNGWFKAARRLDLNRLANEAFHLASRCPPHSLCSLIDNTLCSPTHSILLPPLTSPLHCDPCSNAHPFACTSPQYPYRRWPHSDHQTPRTNLLLLWLL
jgi:hypothetical protein